MIARLLISSSLDKIKKEIAKTLACNLSGCSTNHPDILYFKQGEKLGIEQAKKIKGHFSLKPFSAKGRGVVLEDVSVMTAEAQNALLKTLEELPESAVLILGANSDANLLPTILSRCQIIRLQNPRCPMSPTSEVGFEKDIEKLLAGSIEERFSYIGKLKDKEEFLQALVVAFRQLLHTPNKQLKNQEVISFLKKLLQAEQWTKQNVNIRPILEYLMLVMPKAV